MIRNLINTITQSSTRSVYGTTSLLARLQTHVASSIRQGSWRRKLQLAITTACLAAAPLASAASVDLTVKPAPPGGQGWIGPVLFAWNQDKAGTGVFKPFYRLQQSGNNTTCEGYNASARPVMPDVNTSVTWTHDLQLRDIGIQSISGTPYYVIGLDINQHKNVPYLSLDAVKLYLSSAPIAPAKTIADLEAQAQLVYDLDDTQWTGADNEVLLDYSLSPGSGYSDMLMFVPVDVMGFDQDKYVTLYSHFGGKGGIWEENSGFEEWAGLVREEGTPVPQPAALGDYAWIDSNGNGIQDDGERPLANVLAAVYRADNNTLMGSATTDAQGYWKVGNLVPGSYYVKFTLPSGYQFTLARQGGDAGLDSDADPATGQTGAYTLADGDADMTVDCGFVPLEVAATSISGSVYDDVNQPPGQNKLAPLSGVTIKLYVDANGDQLPDDEASPWRTTTTDSNGYYEFLYVPVGASYVIIEQDPPLYLSSHDVFGTPTDNRIALTVHDPGVYPLNDFWDYTPKRPEDPMPTQIGSLVWLDRDNDGLFNPATDNGADGVTLQLWQVDDSGNRMDSDANPDNGLTPYASTTTSGGGLYLFNGMPPGRYQVEIPASNFATGAPLYVARTTAGVPVALDNQQDDDNNGLQPDGAGTAVFSPVISLAADEPLDGSASGTESGPGASLDNLNDPTGDMTVDFAFKLNPPLAAGLDYFRAVSAETDGVLLTWRTLVEVGTLGFRLERESAAGDWEPVKTRLIAAQGQSQSPQSYSTTDAQGAAKYRLIEVELSGHSAVLAETTVASRATTALERNADGLKLNVRGQPNGSAVVETANSITGPWVALGAVALNAQGTGSVNLSTDPAEAMRFFRVRE
jgi:hypothetical protein